MTQQRANELLQEALDLLSRGERAEAAELLKQAVEEDDNNVEIWVALARALDDRDEKRIALTTILRLDPQNAYAASELKETEQKAKKADGNEEWVPGITRRTLRLTILGLVGFTVVVCGLVGSIVMGANNQRAAQRAELTRAVVQISATWEAINAEGTRIAGDMTQVADDATATAIATITPTLTPSRTPDLPPTFTPQPTATEFSLRVLEAPPGNLPGTIYAWGLINPSSDIFLNLLAYQPGSGDESVRLNPDLSRNVSAGSGSIVYERPITGGFTLYIAPINSPRDSEDLAIRWIGQRILEPVMPRIARSANRVAFVATNTETNTRDIFVIDLTSNEVQRVTSDGATYLEAAISPDGSRLAAVRRGENGQDLVMIDLNDPTFPQRFLTSDGDGLLERDPDFSPDGQRLVYAVAANNRPNDHDLYLILNTSVLENIPILPIMTTEADEILPRFSPDGGYIVFASNQSLGVYNLFIYEDATLRVYQLTVSEDPVYPGAWLN